MRSPTFALPSYAELWREALRGHEAVALAFGFPAVDAQPGSYRRVELALSPERRDQLAELLGAQAAHPLRRPLGVGDDADPLLALAAALLLALAGGLGRAGGDRLERRDALGALGDQDAGERALIDRLELREVGLLGRTDWRAGPDTTTWFGP